MPFIRLGKFARDDAFVKFVFDHIRNIGIAGLVLGAAIWKQKNIGSGWMAIWDYFSFVVLVSCGSILLFLNQENLFHKVRNTSLAVWAKIAVGISYALLFSSLLTYFQQGK